MKKTKIAKIEIETLVKIMIWLVFFIIISAGVYYLLRRVGII